MTSIDEAIAHAREIAEEQRKDNENCKYKAEYGCKGCADYYSKPCIEYAEEHEQIAEWLEELKDYRDKNKMVVRVDAENMDSIKDKIEELSKYAESQYNKAIDEAMISSAKAICIGCGYLKGTQCTYKGCNCGVSKPMLESVMKALEKLKAGVEE